MNIRRYAIAIATVGMALPWGSHAVSSAAAATSNTAPVNATATSHSTLRYVGDVANVAFETDASRIVSLRPFEMISGEPDDVPPEPAKPQAASVADTGIDASVDVRGVHAVAPEPFQVAPSPVPTTPLPPPQPKRVAAPLPDSNRSAFIDAADETLSVPLPAATRAQDSRPAAQYVSSRSNSDDVMLLSGPKVATSVTPPLPDREELPLKVASAAPLAAPVAAPAVPNPIVVEDIPVQIPSVIEPNGSVAATPVPMFPVQPSWEVGGDFLVWRRNGGTTRELPTECACDEVTHRRPKDYHDWDSGVRLWLRREACPGGTNLELNGFLVEGWGQVQRREGPQFALGQNIGIGDTTTLYDSQLLSSELNFSRYWDNWTEVLIGARWLRLDEFSRVEASGNLIPSLTQQHDLRNDMVGGHVGIRQTLFDDGGYFTLLTTAKAGVLANNIERETVGLNAGLFDDSTTSFVGELEIRGTQQLTAHWTISAGYNFLWLSDVALGIDQYFTPNAVRSDSSFFAHGFTFGVSRAW